MTLQRNLPHPTKLVLAAAAALLLSPAVDASARPRAVATSQAGLSVDVSRLRQLGLGPTADVVQNAVARELGGGLSGRPGARVVVRLTGLSMPSYAGSDSGGGGGSGGGASGSGGNFDYLEGDILVLGAGGEVVAQRHQVVSSPASSGGAYFLPGSEMRRVEAVSRSFAEWVRRSAI